MTLIGEDRDNIEVIRRSGARTRRYNITQSDGTLRIEYIRDFIHIRFISCPITVKFPRGYCGSIDAATSNASMNAENLDSLGEVVMKTSNASLSLTSIAAASASAVSSNGTIRASALKIKNALTLTTSNGHVEAGKISASECSIKTSNGSVRIDNISADTTCVVTSNAAVHGIMPGDMNDYRIHSQTSNARSSLPSEKRSGSRTLSVVTSNGRIDVDFEA